MLSGLGSPCKSVLFKHYLDDLCEAGDLGTSLPFAKVLLALWYLLLFYPHCFLIMQRGNIRIRCFLNAMSYSCELHDRIRVTPVLLERPDPECQCISLPAHLRFLAREAAPGTKSISLQCSIPNTQRAIMLRSPGCGAASGPSLRANHECPTHGALPHRRRSIQELCQHRKGLW